MRDSDWSREKLLRSDWLLPSVAMYTTPRKHLCPKNHLIVLKKYMY